MNLQDSYWAYAHEVCGMPLVDKSPNKFVRIDKYWSKIGELVGDKGCYMYQQLIALIKCVLSLSHGNAVPERGSSINNILLEAHGYTIKNDTIVALRIVKDEVRRVGGVVNFILCSQRN